MHTRHWIASLAVAIRSREISDSVASVQQTDNRTAVMTQLTIQILKIRTQIVNLLDLSRDEMKDEAIRNVEHLAKASYMGQINSPIYWHSLKLLVLRMSKKCVSSPQ